MTRMSRAGRKAQISKVLYQAYKRDNLSLMKAGNIARRVGMRSTTEFKKMCRELIYEDHNIIWTVVDGVAVYGWRPMKQIELPQRFININGKSHKIANWVADAKEFENA